jgi:hypothetical protein
MFVLDGGSFPEVIEIRNGIAKQRNMRLPFEFLSHALQPRVMPRVSYQHCGYVVLPYKILRGVAAIHRTGTDGWRAFSINVSWPQDQYPGQADGGNLTKLRESTYAVPQVQQPLIEFVDFFI